MDDDNNTFIITGGRSENDTLVSRYNQDGWIEDLPNLNAARQNHACGTYVDDNNIRVSSVQSKM